MPKITKPTRMKLLKILKELSDVAIETNSIWYGKQHTKALYAIERVIFQLMEAKRWTTD